MQSIVFENRPLRRILVGTVLTILAVGGCGDSTSPVNSEFGHYTLATVNGQSLPFTMTGTVRGTIVVQNATIDLSAGTTASGGKPQYLAGITGTANAAGPQQILTDNGTYALTGATLTFSSNLAPGVQYVGALNNNELTLTLPGVLFGTSGTFVLLLRR
jgi:hypothetical protein